MKDRPSDVANKLTTNCKISVRVGGKRKSKNIPKSRGSIKISAMFRAKRGLVVHSLQAH